MGLTEQGGLPWLPPPFKHPPSYPLVHRMAVFWFAYTGQQEGGLFPLTGQSEECSMSVVRVVVKSGRHPTPGRLTEVHLAQRSSQSGVGK